MVGVEAAARSLIIVLPLLWLGCGAEPTTTVKLSQRVDHLMWVVDDHQRELLLDTGAPTTILRPEVAGATGAAVVAWRDPAGFNDGTTTVLASEKLPAIELKNGLIGMDLLRKRRFTSSARLAEWATSKRSCTAVATLFTFCPPGPEEVM